MLVNQSILFHSNNSVVSIPSFFHKEINLWSIIYVFIKMNRFGNEKKSFNISEMFEYELTLIRSNFQGI
jgi:hypothetical protein